MCRSALEGGRRCPCDGSEQRRLRRHNQAAIATFREQTTRPVHREPQPAVTIPTVPTIAQLQEGAANIRTLHEQSQNEDEDGYVTLVEATGISHRLHQTADRSQIHAILEQATTRYGADLAAHIDNEVPEPAEPVEQRQALEQAMTEALNHETAFLNQMTAMYGERAANFASAYGQKVHRGTTTRDQYMELVRERGLLDDNHEQYVEDTAELGCRRNVLREAEETYRAFRTEQDTMETEFLRARKEATVRVLEQLRPLGGELNLHPGVRPEVAEKFYEAVSAVYPKDWMEAASNQSDGLLMIESVPKRAHYMRMHAKSVKKRTPVIGNRWLAADDPTPRDSPSERWEKTEETDEHGRVLWKQHYYETWDDGHWVGEQPANEQKKPKGTGWKLTTRPGNRTVNGVFEAGERYIWHRPQISAKTELVVVPATIRINPGDEERTAVHEFAHRVEASRTPTGARIRSLQAAFYRRRTTGDDGVQQRLEPIDPSDRSEVTRPDGFADRYMGRRYFDGTRRESDEAFEILSMSAEGLFSGSVGGLTGARGYKKDLDTRNFILGLWATA